MRKFAFLLMLISYCIGIFLEDPINKNSLANLIESIKQSFKLNILNEHLKQLFEVNISNEHLKQLFEVNISNEHLKQSFKLNILNERLKRLFKMNVSEKNYSLSQMRSEFGNWFASKKNTRYRYYEKQNPLQTAEGLKRLPLMKREISEKIRQEIIESTEKRMQKDAENSTFLQNNYDDELAKEYVYQFLDRCCNQSSEREELSIWNNQVKEKIQSYPINRKWELTGALLTIAQTAVGQDLLLTFMTLYEKNPAIPRIMFFIGNNGGAFGGQGYSGNLFYGVIIPVKGPLESVYNNSSGNIDYLYSPRCAVVFHEMIHVLHKIEDSAMLVKRYVSLDVAAQLFSITDIYGNRVVKRREENKPFLVGNAIYVKKEIEDEKWKEIKTDFCGNNKLLCELKEEFTNDEEFYTIFGFFKDKDGLIKRDMLCESSFTSELFGYVRCGHWGPSDIRSIYNFNVMVNYGISEMYIEPTDDEHECFSLVNEEIEDEKMWTQARENGM